MMRWIVGGSLKFPLLLVGVAAALMVAGVTRTASMPVDVLPEFSPPVVEVQTEALGLSAPEVESLVTLNLEELLNGTPWLESIRSTSVPGLSSILLTFKPGTDVLRARQLVAERLTLAVTIPNVAQPPVILQPLSATSRVMMVGLSSTSVSPIEMGVLTRWNIRPALLSVPGVANVAVWGQRERQLQVQVDPQRLLANDVTLDQIVHTAGNAMWVSPLSFLEASTPGSGGWVDTPQQRLEVRHVFPISTAHDLAKVTIDDAAPLRLRDVANVVEDHQPLIGDAVLQSGSDMLLVIEKFPNANTLDVTRGVERKLRELQPGLSGIHVDTSVYRPATYVSHSIDDLTRAFLIGAVLVIVALAALLFEWRAAAIAVVAMALSLAAAGFVLYLLGTTMNAMVLTGLMIALALIVDDAIIDVENITRHLRRRREEDDAPTAEIILESVLELRGAAVYATLVVLLPVLPILALTGMSGKLLTPLAVAYLLAVLASMAVALTVTPALAMVLLSRTSGPRRESPLVGWIRRGHAVALARVMRRPRRLLIPAALLALAGLASAPTLAHPTVPAFKEPDLLVRWDGPAGMSEPEMNRLLTNASQELRSIPGVRDVGAHLGRAVLGDRVVDVNSAELWVSIDPGADYGDAVSAVRRTIDGYPGMGHDVNTYLADQLQQVETSADTPPGKSIVVRLYGPRLDILRSKAEEVRRALSGIHGVADLSVERQVEQPEVHIEVNLARAERYGLKPGDVRRAAATMLAGLEVGSLFQQQKVFQVLVWTTPESRHSLTDIGDVLIDTPGGGHVRLADVATVSIAPTPTVIHREGVSRRVDVSLNVHGRDPGAVVGDIKQRLARVTWPLESHAEVLGEYTHGQAVQRRELGFGVAAAIVMILLLQAAFQSWRLAAFAIATLPFAMAGGVLAALTMDGELSRGALIGLLAVFGIAARNGVLLIRRYQQLEEQGEPVGPALVARGTADRLMPIVMSALVTALAVLPLVVSGDIAGLEIVHPLAAILVGGLVTATLLNLLVIPVLYLQIRSMQGRKTHAAL